MHFVSMDSSAAELSHNAQVQKEQSQAKTICEKRLLFNDSNSTVLH